MCVFFVNYTEDYTEVPPEAFLIISYNIMSALKTICLFLQIPFLWKYRNDRVFIYFNRKYADIFVDIIF